MDKTKCLRFCPVFSAVNIDTVAQSVREHPRVIIKNRTEENFTQRPLFEDPKKVKLGKEMKPTI